MLIIKDLHAAYPDNTPALCGIKLKARSCDSIAIIGSNGAGKTSLFSVLTGLLAFSEGSVEIDNILLNKKNLASIRSKVGLVFQNPDDQLFLPTVYDNLAFGLRNNGCTETETGVEINEILEQLGITHLKKRSALKLSGGEKRICAIAAVLVMKPQILLFDEPTAFLDPRSRRNLIEIINSLYKTKLIATHDLDFANKTCPHAVLLKQGKILASGETTNILNNTALLYEGGL